MKPGPDSQVLGVEITKSLPRRGDLLRWSGRDARGAEVELVSPRPLAALRPGAADRFSAAHQLAPPLPGRLPTTAWGRVDGRLVAILPAGHRPLPSDLRIQPGQAIGLAGWLGPAAMASAHALGGELDPSELVLDPDGVPLVAPTGTARTESLSTPRRYRAPEGGEGPGAPLYGLGVWLHEGLTGSPPPQTDDRAAALRLQLPDAPAPVISLLEALLGSSPHARVAAIRAIARTEAPTPLSQARTAPPSRPAPPLTRAAGQLNPSARRDIGLAPWAVVAHPADLSQPAMRRLAALSGVPVPRLEAAGRHGLPLAVAGGRQRAEALRARDALGAALTELQVEPTRVPTLATMGGAAAALLLALMAPLLMLLSPVATGLALALSAAALVLLLTTTHRQVAHRDALIAAQHLPLPPPTEVSEAQTSLHARTQHTRAAVLRADLPVPIRADLLDALDDIEDQLDQPHDTTALQPLRDAVDAIAHSLGAGRDDNPREAAERARRRAAQARAASQETR